MKSSQRCTKEALRCKTSQRGGKDTHIVTFVVTNFALLAFDAPPIVRQGFVHFGRFATPLEARGMSAAAAFVARNEQLGCTTP